MGMRVLSVERLMGDVIAVEPPGKLTVMLGEVVRVLLQVEYRGIALVGAQAGAIHVSYGRQNAWFNEDGNKQNDILAEFAESFDWAVHGFACDITIGGVTGTDFDLYAKIMGVPGADIFTPTYLGVLDVLGAPEFQNFGITSYDIL